MAASYLAAINAHPGDDRLKLNFANFLIAFEKPMAAHAILEEVYRRNPTDSEMAITLFKLCAKLGKSEEAATALLRIEEIFPEHPNLEKFRSTLRADSN